MNSLEKNSEAFSRNIFFLLLTMSSILCMEMLQLNFVLIFACQFVLVVIYCDPLIVQTNKGWIKGRYQTTILGNKTYIAFKGVPYAIPPIGHLRFKVRFLLPNGESEILC